MSRTTIAASLAALKQKTAAGSITPVLLGTALEEFLLEAVLTGEIDNRISDYILNGEGDQDIDETQAVTAIKNRLAVVEQIAQQAGTYLEDLNTRLTALTDSVTALTERVATLETLLASHGRNDDYDSVRNAVVSEHPIYFPAQEGPAA